MFNWIKKTFYRKPSFYDLYWAWAKWNCAKMSGQSLGGIREREVIDGYNRPPESVYFISIRDFEHPILKELDIHDEATIAMFRHSDDGYEMIELLPVSYHYYKYARSGEEL